MEGIQQALHNHVWVKPSVVGPGPLHAWRLVEIVQWNSCYSSLNGSAGKATLRAGHIWNSFLCAVLSRRLKRTVEGITTTGGSGGTEACRHSTTTGGSGGMEAFGHSTTTGMGVFGHSTTTGMTFFHYVILWSFWSEWVIFDFFITPTFWWGWLDGYVMGHCLWATKVEMKEKRKWLEDFRDSLVTVLHT